MFRWLVATIFLLLSSQGALSQFQPGGVGFPGFAGASAAESSSFNGGRSQVNSNFLQGGYEYPFLNYLKTAQSWGYIIGNAAVAPADLNSDGYPTVINSGGVYTVFFVPSLTDQPLNYKITWDGSGTIFCTTCTVISGSLSTSGVLVRPTTTRMVFGISAGTNISNLQFFYTGDPTPDASNIFTSKFLQRLREANFGVLRYLNWQNGNNTNVTTWSTRKPLTYAFYAGGEFRAGLTPASAATNSGNDYSIAAPAINSVTGAAWDGVLRDKTTVTMKFNASQTEATLAAVTITCTVANPVVINWAGNTLSVGDAVGFNTSATLPSPVFPGGNFYVSATGFSAGTSFQISATSGGASLNCVNGTQSGTQSAVRLASLNVGSTGAKIIKQPTGEPLSTGSNSAIASGVYATLVYDLSLNCWLKFGGDKAQGDRGLLNGVPPEIFMELARQVGAHPYVVTPYLSIDPATDFMPSLAALFAARQPSWMSPIYEGVNEEWNTAASFYGSRYGWNKAFVNWGTWQSTNDWQGQTISVLGQIVNAAYGSPPVRAQTKYKLVNGIHTATGGTTSASNARLNSTQFVSTGLPSQAPYTNSAAYNWTTHIAVAMYIEPSEYGANQEVVDAFNWYVTNAGNAAAQAVIAASYIDTLNSGSGALNLANVNILYGNWYTWAQNNWGGSIKIGMLSYEGGYNSIYSSSAVTSPITGATAANPCVLTLATTNVQGISGHSANSGNPAVIGMTLSISGVGGMTQLNGNTYTVTAVAGNSVTINVDASAFSSYTSGGTATYVSAPTWLNALRKAGKDVPAFQTYTTTNYTNFVNAGGVFPSLFQLGGGLISGNSALDTGGPWSVLDPDTFATPDPPQWNAIKAFNANWLLKRDIDPASNDNDPMWLEKAA